MKSANFYQIIWDPLQDAIFQKILILKHDFNYSYYPIEGFILIFYLCQTIKEYKSYQKVRFNLGDPVHSTYGFQLREMELPNFQNFTTKYFFKKLLGEILPSLSLSRAPLTHTPKK